MARDKKEAAAEAVEKVKAVAEDAKATVKAAAESVADKAKTVKSNRAAKKTTEKAVKAPRAKKSAEIQTKVVIELPTVSESADTLVERAKSDWTAKGNSLDDMKQLTLYINAVEGMVYYVVNDDYLSGNFAI
ncbi:MAG: hypothetical protein J5753_05180 [Oscillospiraceae bacterium]|nr:hypothetical protein [Oscillospiraceae bacterium]